MGVDIISITISSFFLVTFQTFAIFSPGSSKKEWLSNANDRHQGVEPQDIQKNFEGMTRDEVYRLITPEYVVSKVEEMFKKYVK